MMHSVTGTREVEILYAGVRTFEVKFQYHRFPGSLLLMARLLSPMSIPIYKLSQTIVMEEVM